MRTTLVILALFGCSNLDSCGKRTLVVETPPVVEAAPVEAAPIVEVKPSPAPVETAPVEAAPVEAAPPGK